MLTGYKTIIGALIAAVPAVANLLGFDVAPGFSEQANQAITDILALIGGAIAIYGRLAAQTPGWLVKRSPQ